MTADDTLATDADASKAVEEAARAARGTVADLAAVPGERLDEALRAIADALARRSGPVLEANEADMVAARADGIGGALLVRVPGQSSARALVSQPGLIPLVILRGSGDSTRSLAAEAARHGVRTMAHADGGAVLYVDAAADLDLAGRLIEASLDRLGVCNRLNLLLLHPSLWDAFLPHLTALLDRLGIAASLPPHAHPLGHEWALDSGSEATVTVAPADGPRAAAVLANEETSGLAAAIVTQDRAAADEFLHRYAGTGAFWNSTTRLLDGFKLFSVLETGINIDAVPGPRGPVTFRDLYLRQFVVAPS